ncbi:hypothetical protein [Polaromonas sp.]|uniref:hypothetical protein n=1 Tax=Polaromonas sp. TaxID=1869339 RepID=UPI002735061C|nr:hypothetical protein [Polaromonas sp.]MDP3758019.1 hypothetical protein [Polaromonas sp.]
MAFLSGVISDSFPLWGKVGMGAAEANSFNRLKIASTIDCKSENGKLAGKRITSNPWLLKKVSRLPS